MRRYALPAVAGVLVLGAATAFAASLTVNTSSLGAGNGTVASCNASASVSYNSTYASGLPGYKVTTAPISSAAACAGLSYKVTLTGAGNAALAEVTGTLDGTGADTPNFTASNILAHDVTGVSVVITG